MTVILLEALAAGILFVLAVWWTMFAGRNKGELPRPEEADDSATGDTAKPPEKQQETDREPGA